MAIKRLTLIEYYIDIFGISNVSVSLTFCHAQKCRGQAQRHHEQDETMANASAKISKKLHSDESTAAAEKNFAKVINTAFFVRVDSI